ncbi:MAG: hypothetical protein LCH37_02390 [Bacteroidetes bacterium]|nr:hypothetical protein [Bacteroidota bacterium]
MQNLTQKLNIKNQSTFHILGYPDEFSNQLEHFTKIGKVYTQTSSSNSPEFILAFVKTLSEVEQVAKTCQKLNDTCLVWLAYPKMSSKKYTCEFNRDNGWEALGQVGFEPVRQIALDEDWSALRFKKAGTIKNFTRSSAISSEGKKKLNQK